MPPNTWASVGIVVENDGFLSKIMITKSQTSATSTSADNDSHPFQRTLSSAAGSRVTAPQIQDISLSHSSSI